MKSDIEQWYSKSFEKEYKKFCSKNKAFPDCFQRFVEMVLATTENAKNGRIQEYNFTRVNYGVCPNYYFYKERKFGCRNLGHNGPGRIIFSICNRKLYVLDFYTKGVSEDISDKDFGEYCRLMSTTKQGTEPGELKKLDVPLFRGILNK